jgi:CheY-like chemotaxis protein
MLCSERSVGFASPIAARWPSFRVLVVEDNHVIAMDIEGMLRTFGASEIGIATELSGALAALHGNTWDLAILDHHLAEGETTSVVASSLKAMSVPILRIGADLVSLSEQRLEGGVLLAKPFSQGQLKEAIEAVLQAG